LEWVEETTYFGFHPVGVVAFYGRQSSQKKWTGKLKVPGPELERR
jgi:hypothetical protein